MTSPILIAQNAYREASLSNSLVDHTTFKILGGTSFAVEAGTAYFVVMKMRRVQPQWLVTMHSVPTHLSAEEMRVFAAGAQAAGAICDALEAAEKRALSR